MDKKIIMLTIRNNGQHDDYLYGNVELDIDYFTRQHKGGFILWRSHNNHQFLKRTIKMSITHAICKFMNTLASIVLFVMMLLTVIDVGLRYFFNHPLMGTTELTEAMMASICFLGLAWCAVRNEHLTVDLLVSKFRPRIQAGIEALTVLFGLGIVALISWRNVVEALSLYHLKITSSLLRVPLFPFYLMTALGFAILGLVMVGIVWKNTSKVFTK